MHAPEATVQARPHAGMPPSPRALAASRASEAAIIATPAIAAGPMRSPRTSAAIGRTIITETARPTG
ncbi:MAG: hypothetical protein ACKOUS_20430 [Alphaproteobacteria bacterium]